MKKFGVRVGLHGRLEGEAGRLSDRETLPGIDRIKVDAAGRRWQSLNGQDDVAERRSGERRGQTGRRAPSARRQGAEHQVDLAGGGLDAHQLESADEHAAELESQIGFMVAGKHSELRSRKQLTPGSRLLKGRSAAAESH